MTAVTDTSVALNLSFLGQDTLLDLFFDSVLAPVEVRKEFVRLVDVDARFKGLIFPEFVEVVRSSQIDPFLAARHHLHSGEVAALSLAAERKVDAVLLDDRAAREMATRLNVRCIGLVGILLQGKAAGHVSAVKPLLDRLSSGARFWLSSSIRKEILQRVGEASGE